MTATTDGRLVGLHKKMGSYQTACDGAGPSTTEDHEVTCPACVALIRPSELDIHQDDQLRLVLRGNGELYVWTPNGLEADQMADLLEQFSTAFREGEANRVR